MRLRCQLRDRSPSQSNCTALRLFAGLVPPAIVRHLPVLPFISKLAAREASIGAAASSTAASSFAVTRQRNDKKALISSLPQINVLSSIHAIARPRILLQFRALREFNVSLRQRHSRLTAEQHEQRL